MSGKLVVKQVFETSGDVGRVAPKMCAADRGGVSSGVQFVLQQGNC